MEANEFGEQARRAGVGQAELNAIERLPPVASGFVLVVSLIVMKTFGLMIRVSSILKSPKKTGNGIAGKFFLIGRLAMVDIYSN